MTLKISLGKPTEAHPKKHLVLTCSLAESVHLYDAIFEQVLKHKFRPHREIVRSKEMARYRFPMKYLERLKLTFPQADISPGLDKRLIKKAREEYNEVPVPDITVPRLKRGTKLRGHQKIFVDWFDTILEEHGRDAEVGPRLFLNDEMRLGKTLSAVAAHLNSGFKHTLIVCPNNTKRLAWANDIKKFTRIRDVAVVDTEAGGGAPGAGKRAREEAIARHAEITIIPWEVLRLHPEIAEFKYDLVVADEFHRIKNPNAAQTEAFFQIDAWAMLLMSGTPLLNGRIEEVWSSLHAAFPDRFPNYHVFKNGHTIRRQGQVVAYKNLPSLKVFMDPLETRRRKDQIYRDLPPLLFSRVEMELTAEQRKLYNRIRDDFMLEIEDGKRFPIVSVLAQMTRLKQACFSPELYGGSKHSAKLDRMAEDLAVLAASGQKTIIGTQWRTAANIMARHFKQYEPAMVHGKIKGSKREAEVKRFQEDDDCMLFIGTIKSCKEGIDLSAGGVVMFSDKGWEPAYNTQFAHRPYGVDTPRAINVIEYFAQDSIEGPIEDLLQRKTNVNNAWVDRKDGGVRQPRIALEDIRELLAI